MSDVGSSAVPSFAPLSRALTEHWDLADAEVEEHPGGMSSLTWIVSANGRRLVAKSVNARRYGRQFADGLAAAGRLSAAAIPAGAPVPTVGGALTALVGDRALALLEWVGGTPLDENAPGTRPMVGRTLARAHLALGIEPARPDFASGIDLTAPYLLVRPWIRPAIARCRAALEALGVEQLTWGPLHGDPAAEAFLYDADTDVCGLIDWGAYSVGPRAFDLASAVMYAGGVEYAQPLISAYLAEGALSAAEVERTLAAMLGWRWACQAWYFSRRIAESDLTGIADASENEAGLTHAKSLLDPPRIRDYQPSDETSWLRCRVVAFLDTCYFDDVCARKPDVDVDSAVDLVAVDDGQVVGMLTITVRGELATIENVCVHPDHQGRGIATHLLQEACARLLDGPAQTLDAWTREDTAALAWYARNGFTEEHTYLHVQSGYGQEHTSRLVTPRAPYKPMAVFAHASRDLEEQARREHERVYVCRRMVRTVRRIGDWPV